jgi:RNA 2',3'-cyclic 3'-phosphodiesterase
MSKTARTFIAIELPADVRHFLSQTQDRLRRAGADVKWVRPDLIHLTLVFLGEVPVEMQPDVEAAVRQALAGMGPINLQVSGAGRFPTQGLPRTVWVGVSETGDRLLRLQKAVAEATAAFAEKPEDRAYTAHLTLGRVKSGKHARDLTGMLDAMAGATGPALEAREVTIFKSELSAQGPAYTALARVALSGA